MKRLLPLFAFCVFVSPVFAADPAPAAGDFLGPIGLQLYSLRDQYKREGIPATMDRVKAYGFKEVETASTNGASPEDYLKEMQSRGLTPISGHYQYDALAKDVNAIIKEAKALGLQYVICPWISHGIGEFSNNDAHRAAADFNKWGEAFKKAGIQFGYHPHGYEFQPLDDGSTLFDVLMAETKPEFVTYEMDVFWITFPGVDPVKLLEKYPTRWSLMHLKDLRKGVRTGAYTGHTSLENDVPLGTGQVNWPAVLSTAVKVGIKHFFIEDESPTSTEAIPQSVKYLQSLGGKM